jgi:ferredoxin
MTLLPTVDEFSCCGHGDCAAIAPEVFQVDDVAVVLGPGDPDRVRAAAKACPAAAILLPADA